MATAELDTQELLREATEKHWSHRTHDGKVTIVSPSGEHRTLRVRTQRDDAEFMPGKRLVALLTGSDNESSYRTIGLVGEDGRLVPWKKNRGTKLEQIGRMLEWREHYEQRGCTYMVEATCCRCGRTLTTPESIERGRGPTCSARD